MTTHQMRADGNGVNVAGWEGANDSLVVKQSQLVSVTFTAMTTPTGQISVPTTPIAALSRQLDYLGNMTNNFGITILDAGNGTTYYSSAVDPTAGLITVVTTQGGSTTVNSTSVKVTYFVLAPVEGTLNADGTVSPNVYIQSNIIVPTDSQSRLQTTVQTQNAVSVATVTWSNGSSFNDTNGYDRVSATMLNSAATSATLQLSWSNDGTNVHFQESVTGSTTTLNLEVPTRARYVRVDVYNGNTASNTISAWLYEKV